MDRFDAIRTLLAAVDGGSLSAASRSLRLPLTTVSRRVAELEAQLGTQLLVRTSRRLLLTEAGTAYVAAVRRVLDELGEAERAAAGEYRTPRGELLVTASIMFGKLWVAPILHDFLAAFPEVTVRLVLSDSVVDLAENHIDVAVRVGRLPDSSLVARRVGEVFWVTVASPAYLGRHGVPAVPEDLAQHRTVAFEGLRLQRDWTFGRGAARRVVAVRPRFSISTADAVLDAAIAGVGIARVLCYQAADAVRDGRLVPVLGADVPEALPVHLVHGPQPLMPLKLRAFLDFVSPRLRAALDGIVSTYAAAHGS